jgi:hypothetical protein
MDAQRRAAGRGPDDGAMKALTAGGAGERVSGAWSLRREVMRRLSSEPSLYIPAYRCFGRERKLLVGPHTELVIEGFPRSANSFAVVAFEMAQHNSIHIAHHLHAAAQVKAAVKMGLPCMVLIRDPFDAIASLLVRERGLSAAQAIEEYVTFYTAAATVKTDCVAAPFETVTTHYEEIIRRVNARYGTAFHEFVNEPDRVEAVFAELERLESVHGRLPGEERVARPSAARDPLLRRVRLELTTGAAARAMSRAAAAHDAFLRD